MVKPFSSPPDYSDEEGDESDTVVIGEYNDHTDCDIANLDTFCCTRTKPQLYHVEHSLSQVTSRKMDGRYNGDIRLSTDSANTLEDYLHQNFYSSNVERFTAGIELARERSRYFSSAQVDRRSDLDIACSSSTLTLIQDLNSFHRSETFEVQEINSNLISPLGFLAFGSLVPVKPKSVSKFRVWSQVNFTPIAETAINPVILYHSEMSHCSQDQTYLVYGGYNVAHLTVSYYLQMVSKLTIR
ncbi:hypothetical protein GE061_000918 [Apolygus lucorum]|uniref:Uncharacterized protein n=1 Tax=Apolygus lucorum TaxID=248454 RepID=A0A6A4JY90_APOLU|nr:hypothetical protein GE061_000918 [Apolygus lucorum]